MFYERELDFFRRILRNIHIDTSLVAFGETSCVKADRGLRDFLNMNDDYEHLMLEMWKNIKSNVIYQFTDDFLCSYIFMLLPDTEQDTVLIAGPYSTKEITHRMLLETAEKYSVPTQVFSHIEKYYGNVPFIGNDRTLMSLFNSFGETVWGDIDSFSVQTAQSRLDGPSAELVQSIAGKADDPLLAIQMLEARYESERSLMQAVSQGMTHKAEQIFNNASNLSIEERVSDPVRNLKNYMIIMNTLMRKAAEYGSVHPFYIDRISSDFARRIELIKSAEEVGLVQREMVHKYCNLVKQHSMKKYSLLVQKVMTMVDSDLTADLSLSRQAQLLNVNASYLSALFKKETGQTLTEYVTKKRVEHAAYLLKSTTLQIQTVAQHCGIYDVNYFTKMFKKYAGKTPKEYRGDCAGS